MISSSRRSFLKHVSLSTLGLWGRQGFAESSLVGALPRGTAQEAGVSEAGIMAFLDAIEAADMELHSLMILRHGKVVAEQGHSLVLPEKFPRSSRRFTIFDRNSHKPWRILILYGRYS